MLELRNLMLERKQTFCALQSKAALILVPGILFVNFDLRVLYRGLPVSFKCVN